MPRKPNRTQDDRREAAPYRVRLPGFISEETVGLGDVIKKATTAVGITPCAGCARRAAVLNRWVTFTGRTRR
jgi:hypothetical protein